MAEEFLVALGRHLHARRTQLDLSLEEVAQRAGLHRAYVSEIERGERNPSIGVLYKLAAALKMPFSKFVALSEGRKSAPRVAATRTGSEKTTNDLELWTACSGTSDAQAGRRPSGAGPSPDPHAPPVAPAADGIAPGDLLALYRERISDLEVLLARAEDRLRIKDQIIDSVPAMIWLKDAENRILDINSLAANKLGMPKSAIIGRSTYELYPDQAAKYHRDDLEVINTGRPKLGIVELFTPVSLKAGSQRWVRTDKFPFFDADGNVVGVIVAAMDITDLEITGEALKEVQRRFAGNNASLTRTDDKQPPTKPGERASRIPILEARRKDATAS